MSEQWTYSDAEKNGSYLGLIEFQGIDGEWHNFEVMQTPNRLVFGGPCNVGFLESGYMILDDAFSLDENLATMVDELGIYYNYSPDHVEFIVCNERM